MSADLVIKNGWVVSPEGIFKGGVAIQDGRFAAIGVDSSLPRGREEIDAKGNHLLPGIIDGHVHFREPGLTHKEDFNTGSRAAVAGGVTMVIDMPNTLPPTQDAEKIQEKRRLAEEKSLVDFSLLGVILQNNINQILPMARAGIVGFKIFFGETTGNLPCPDDGMCLEAFPLVTQSGLPLGIHAENREIIAHCTEKLRFDGKNSPICWEDSRPAVCEAASLAHALFFAETFSTKLHVLHVSSKQGAQLVSEAKKRGLRVTAEATPHHLLRENREMAELGALLKINPPVRGKAHGEALWEGLRLGAIDMIASDHSPHTMEEKTKPVIWDCVSGFCGVETAVSLMLTEVNRGRLSVERYAKIASENPARIWQVYPQKGTIRLGSDGDVTIIDLDKEGVINANQLHSKNKPTPWHGWKVKGMPVCTIVRGHVQMRDGEVIGKPIGRAVLPSPEAERSAP